MGPVVGFFADGHEFRVGRTVHDSTRPRSRTQEHALRVNQHAAARIETSASPTSSRRLAFMAVDAGVHLAHRQRGLERQRDFGVDRLARPPRPHVIQPVVVVEVLREHPVDRRLELLGHRLIDQVGQPGLEHPERRVDDEAAHERRADRVGPDDDDGIVESAAMVSVSWTNADDTTLTTRAWSCPCMISDPPPRAARRMPSSASTLM